MNKQCIFCFLVIAALIYGCTSNQKAPFDPSQIGSIIQNMNSYMKYYGTSMKFDDSTAYLNENDSIIDNKYFFTKLGSGLYFPLRSNRGNIFKLFEVRKWHNLETQGLIRGVALQQLKKANIIGKPLLTDTMLDMNGKEYDSTSLSGKLVFVKFWFIHCVPCVAEMPELNKIVNANSKRSEVTFLSFPFDKAKDLKVFLKNTPFAYHVIPASKDFVFEKIGIESFPTHLLVYNNRILKILKDKSEIISNIKEYDSKIFLGNNKP